RPRCPRPSPRTARVPAARAAPAPAADDPRHRDELVRARARGGPRGGAARRTTHMAHARGRCALRRARSVRRAAARPRYRGLLRLREPRHRVGRVPAGGGRTGDWLLTRWSGGRVVVSGAGFVLGGPVCAALLLIDELRLFVPLLFGTFFLYSWYNGPLSAVILDVVPAAVRASVLGAYVLFSHLAGDAIAPPLIGYLSDRFGLRPAMLLLPTAGAVGGVVILIALSTVGRDMARVRT